MVKNLPTNPGDTGDARDTGSIPGSGKSSGVENGNPFQYFCQENSMDRGSWWFTIHGVTKEPDKIEYAYTHTHTHTLCFRSFNHDSQIQKHCMIGIIFNLWKLRSRLNNSSKS